MKIHIDFFKTTGKWYTAEDYDFAEVNLPASFDEFLRTQLTTVEGKTRVRYAGMTAVCPDWRGVPHLAVVPEFPTLDGRCSRCHHTEGQHNTDGKTCSECDDAYPVGDDRACTGFLKAADTMSVLGVTVPTPHAMLREAARRMKPERRSCNRHDDCDAAEMKAFGKLGYVANFHCHSDDCEECFPK